MMANKFDSVVSDSGVEFSTSNTTGAPGGLANSPPNEVQNLRPFFNVGKGVYMVLKEPSADEDNKKWASGVPQSSSQQPVEANLNASSTSVDGERQPNASTETAPPGEWRDQGATLDSHHSAQASTPAVDSPTTNTTSGDGSVRPSFGQPDSLPPSAWKDQIPTLDPYQPALASPPSPSNRPDSTTTNEAGSHASFSVGQPDFLPLEEENVESSSAMTVVTMPIIGDAKKDKMILSLQTRLRTTQAEVNRLSRELVLMKEKKERGEKDLTEAKKRIKDVKTKGEKASAEMQKEYEAKIAVLEVRLANVEQEKNVQKVELCKQIQELRNQLKEQNSKHYERIIQLKDEKHELELTVEKMKTNEKELEKQLLVAKLEAINLQSQLDCQKHNEELNVLRNESADALQKQVAENEKLKRLLSQMSMGSNSSQGSGTEGKGET